MSRRRFVVGVTGASGALYAQGVMRELARLDCDIHLVITQFGRRLFYDELGMHEIDPVALAGREDHRMVIHPINDVGASIASGSFLHDGMVVVPCSSNGLASIAAGLGGNLLYRAAAVTLKERRPLVLCHREMPLTHIDLENMHRLSQSGAIIAPANPGWYLQPQSVQDLADFVVSRLLDLLGVDHGIQARWDGTTPSKRPEG